MAPSAEQVYEQRINAAMDFVHTHLGEDLRLPQVAAAAGFSPFHFHRVFAAIVGETPREFVARVRIERAAALLLDQPTRTISDVGSQCGFATPSALSRSFKNAFDMSPSEWRSERGAGAGRGAAFARPARVPRDRSATVATVAPMAGSTSARRWELRCGDLAPATVEVLSLADVEVAYVRHSGAFAGDGAVFAAAFERVGAWADGVGGAPSDGPWFAVYHDDPNLTDDDHLRFSACLGIGQDVVPDAPVNRMTIRGGTYAVARFQLGEADYGEAWSGLLGGWLPVSGYEPDDREYYERFPNVAAPMGKRVVDICLPVRRLRR